MLQSGPFSASRGHSVEGGHPGTRTDHRSQGSRSDGEDAGTRPSPSPWRSQSGGGSVSPRSLREGWIGACATLRRGAIARLWERGPSYLKKSRRTPNWGGSSR